MNLRQGPNLQSLRQTVKFRLAGRPVAAKAAFAAGPFLASMSAPLRNGGSLIYFQSAEFVFVRKVPGAFVFRP